MIFLQTTFSEKIKVTDGCLKKNQTRCTRLWGKNKWLMVMDGRVCTMDEVSIVGNDMLQLLVHLITLHAHTIYV